jgi:hypothetical protein
MLKGGADLIKALVLAGQFENKFPSIRLSTRFMVMNLTLLYITADLM